MILSKGDKVKLIKQIKGFDFVGKQFSVVRLTDNSVHLKYEGIYNDIYPYSSKPYGFVEKGFYEFDVSLNMFEERTYPYFERVNKWTEWTKIPIKFLNDIRNCIITESIYKTNGRIIWLKINGDRVKVTCNKEDSFDLNVGLSIGLKRWFAKYNIEASPIEVKHSPVTLKEKRCSLFDMPFYYSFAHCVSIDYNLEGVIASTFDGFYNMRQRFLKTVDKGFFVGDCVYIDNVFNLITNQPFTKMTMEDLRTCVNDMAVLCNMHGVIHLAIPHFGSRKGNLNWEEVKTMIIEEFTDVYLEQGWSNPIEIVACSLD